MLLWVGGDLCVFCCDKVYELIRLKRAVEGAYFEVICFFNLFKDKSVVIVCLKGLECVDCMDVYWRGCVGTVQNTYNRRQ